MEYDFKDLHKCGVFNTPYKIKFLGKYADEYEEEMYIFKSHGEYFSISPDHFTEKCEIMNISLETINSKLDKIYDIELKINRSQPLFTSNIFSIKPDNFSFTSGETYSFTEHKWKDQELIKATIHKSIFAPKTLDEILSSCIILDEGSMTTDIIMIKGKEER